VSDFKAILIEGLFYARDGNLCVEDDDGNHSTVDAILTPMLDKQVQLAVSHLPPHGIEADQPGAGCCRYPGGVGCPVEHDQFPTRLLSFHKEGVLRSDPWRIDQFDGSSSRIPFRGMPGHFGRLASATIVDVEAMREKLSGMDLAAMAAQGINAEGLQAMLDKLKRSMGKL